jgi:hypothetical protein
MAPPRPIVQVGNLAAEGWGIRDLAYKVLALKSMFGQSRMTDTELIEKIMDEKATSRVAHIVDSLRKWKRGTKPIRGLGDVFLKALVKFLGQRGCDATLDWIIDSTDAEFYRGFPDSLRAKLPPPLPQNGRKSVEPRRRQNPFHATWRRADRAAESARIGIERGKIDQKLYYLSQDSVESWSQIISTGSYRQYDECRVALEDVVKQKFWADFLAAGPPAGAVMLGAGGSAKDLIVIQSLIQARQPDDPIWYVFIDTSPFMIDSSITALSRELSERRLNQEVIWESMRHDFTDLDSIKDHLLSVWPRDRNFVWLLPGGTIGNIDEHKFLESVASCAKPGDLLIIGAETVEAELDAGTTKALEEKYRGPEIRRFVAMPLRAAWNDLKMQGSVDTAPYNVRVVAGQGGRGNRHSAIPAAVTVEISIDADGRKITLLTSTRYQESKFVEYAALFGFMHLGTVESRMNSAYKQLAFRFMPAERTPEFR